MSFVKVISMYNMLEIKTEKVFLANFHTHTQTKFNIVMPHVPVIIVYLTTCLLSA